MKNLSFLCIAGAMISLSSCKKDYTCVCTTDYGDGDKLVNTRDVPKSSKKSAKAGCGNYNEVYSSTYTNGSGGTISDTETYVTTCELK